MKEFIKADKLSFKIWSFEWSIFFGLPIGFIIFGFLLLYFYITEGDSVNNLGLIIGFILSMAFGIITYFIQLKKLSFKSIELSRNLDDFKRDVRNILKDNGWDIEYDNKLFLQAKQSRYLLNTEMLLLKFENRKVKWIIIHHPDTKNSIAALFSFHILGYRIIKKIILASA